MPVSEWQLNTELCFVIRKMATETHEMFENVYGNEVLSHMPVPEWFEVF